jgi:glutathione S-transferase
VLSTSSCRIAPCCRGDSEERSAVEEAERWGERLLQPLPRRLFRYLMLTNEAARIWRGSEVMGLPGARLLQWFLMPAVLRLAQLSHADERTVRASLERLPGLLDHVDRLIADGTIGGAAPNAADFQILSSVRVLLEFEDLSDRLGGAGLRLSRPPPVSRLGGADPAGAADRQLSEGSAGMVAISR